MKRFASILMLLLLNQSFAQKMTNSELEQIFRSVSDSIQGEKGRWQFHIKDVLFVSLTDSTNNRMRIISPIVEADKLDENLLSSALIANFHTALDVKYAISDNVMWAAFIHPLGELTKDQVMDAIAQVYYANINFGTTFASTSLVFPGNSNSEETKDKSGFKKRKF